MAEQMNLELHSSNWGVVNHFQCIEWLESLPKEFRTIKKTNALSIEYLVYYFDKDFKQRLGLIFSLSNFKTISVSRYIEGIIVDKTMTDVQEEDLYLMEKWLLDQIIS